MTHPDPDSTARLAATGAASLGTGLALVLPVWVLFGVDTQAGVWLGVLVAMLLVAAAGVLLRTAGLARAWSIAFGTAGVLGIVALVCMGVLVLAQRPGTAGEAALVCGLTGAGVAALVVGTLAVRLPGNTFSTVAVAACVVGILGVLTVGWNLGGALIDERRLQEKVAAFEQAGLEPLAPEVEGLRPRFASTSTAAGVLTTYSLSYGPAGSDWEQDWVDVDVSTQQFDTCPEGSVSTVCERGDGWVARVVDGQLVEVTASTGLMHLRARPASDAPAEQRDAAVWGRALTGAEEIEVRDLLELER